MVQREWRTAAQVANTDTTTRAKAVRPWPSLCPLAAAPAPTGGLSPKSNPPPPTPRGMFLAALAASLYAALMEQFEQLEPEQRLCGVKDIQGLRNRD